MDVVYDTGYTQDTLASEFDNVIGSGKFTLVNGRVTISDINIASGSVRASVWAKNIFDEEYRVYSISAFSGLGFAGAVFNEPRSFGVDLCYHTVVARCWSCKRHKTPALSASRFLGAR